MENQNLKNQRLKNLFATHPSVNRFFFTSDDTPFIEEHHAQAHAQTLKDKSVQPYSRTVLEAIEMAKARLAGSGVADEKIEQFAAPLNGALAKQVVPGNLSDAPAEILPVEKAEESTEKESLAEQVLGKLVEAVNNATLFDEKTTEAPKQAAPVKAEVSDLEAARAEFELVTGKPAGNRKLETLLAQIAEAKSKKNETATQ